MDYFYAVLIGYLCGSIPTAYWIGRLVYRLNIFEHGSKNMGATNVFRVLGKKPGIVTLLIDIFKGVLPVVIVRNTMPDRPTLAFAAAAAAMMGHTLSFWVRFKGGKGVATGLGVFLALATRASLCSLLTFLATLTVSGMVSLGSILAAAALPFFIYWFGELGPVYNSYITAFSAAVAMFVIYRHKTNIQRIIKGEEAKIWQNKTAEKSAETSSATEGPA
ncbi:MAG: acyl-phosphate glycerol 3-phosphate acyltransferase [Candidatus Riflebacteria bacterium HGW-Riflebacteria-2]|jgi:glycerol-3-phosphate acyltransferase PlsY|nr:MAG: acyl-phosphate glycerol 3-phosphate acyltransferase [Candidatus Riflebacteria bacterium HGW-Riflebacteria-2]